MSIRSRSILVVLSASVLLVAPTTARADRVVVYGLAGEMNDEQLERTEDALLAALRALGHSVATPPGGAPPSTASEMDGIALARSADYVLVPHIDGAGAEQYRLHLTVGHGSRVEELVVSVSQAEEAARLRDVLGAMLRPAGLGEDALRLSDVESDEERAAREAAEARRRAEEEAARRAAEDAAAAEEAERRRAEEEAARAEEEAERRRAEEAAARAAEEARRAEEERWSARPVYASDGPWMILVGGEAGGLVGLANNAIGRSTGGAYGLIQLRAARHLVEGLELRGGIDVILGVVAGLDVQVGAAYLFSPFVEPIYLGAQAELGASFAFTGARDAGFLFRVSALAGWRPVEHVYVEVALPELGVMTNGVGALVLGLSLRAGYRFE